MGCGGELPSKPDGKLDIVGDGDGQIAVSGLANVLKVVRAQIDVVRDDKCASPETSLHQVQNIRVKRLGPVSGIKINPVGQILAKGGERVALAQFDQIEQPGIRDNSAEPASPSTVRIPW